MKQILPLVFAVIMLSACSNSHGSNGSGSGRADSVVKISQFNMAGYCDFLIAKDGTYHTVFQEAPGIGKPNFIY